MPPEKLHWRHLYEEVVTSGLCTGCAGCVIACPHDVLGYRDTEGIYRPFQLEDGYAPDNCSHGERGCTSCTRACPRFRAWEPEVDEFLFGRAREACRAVRCVQGHLPRRASDPALADGGQDGGLVSAILLYALEHDIIDAALVSYLEGDGSTWKAVPGVARTREDIVASAGSRYTYSANPMAYAEAVEGGAERIALVGMSCQSSMPPVMKQRKAGKVARRLSLNIGLLCSKTFDDAIFEELFEAKYGLKKSDMKKMNIKGVFQIWMNNGDYHEVPLKECHAWTREGCKLCPDFAAEHADISTGGIGKFNDWTLTIVRTDVGRELMEGMIARRLARDPARRRRPRCHRVDAQAVDQVAQALAGVRHRGAPAAPAEARGRELSDSRRAGGRTRLGSHGPVARVRGAVPDVVFTVGSGRVRRRRRRHRRSRAPLGGRSRPCGRAAPSARIVAFGPHVDDELLQRARADGATSCSPARSSSAIRRRRCRRRPDRLRACPTIPIDIPNADLLLSTTRSVRKRLDLERPVPREVILECVRMAVQAPTASNGQGWRWMIVTDPEKRAVLAELYGSTARPYLEAGANGAMGSDAQTIRVYKSALYLLDVLDRRAGARHPVHRGPREHSRATSRARASTDRSCRRAGASCSRCAPAASVRSGPRCTSSASRRPPSCSASRSSR